MSVLINIADVVVLELAYLLDMFFCGWRYYVDLGVG